MKQSGCRDKDGEHVKSSLYSIQFVSNATHAGALAKMQPHYFAASDGGHNLGTEELSIASNKFEPEVFSPAGALCESSRCTRRAA